MNAPRVAVPIDVPIELQLLWNSKMTNRNVVSVLPRLRAIMALAALLLTGGLAHADVAAPYPGTLTVKSAHRFAAGIEAPIRVYVTEDAEGKVSVTYRTPSALFAPYGNAQLDAMARELDPVFENIVRDAAGS